MHAEHIATVDVRGNAVTDLLTPTAPAPRVNNRRRTRTLVAVLIIAVGAGLFAGARWRSSLDALSGFGPDGTVPARVGDTFYVDAGLGPVPDAAGNVPAAITVTIDSFTAGGTLKTTTATSGTFTDVTFAPYVCVRNSSNVGIGVSPASELAASCSSVTPLVLPATLNLGFTTTQVIYKVSVAKVGTYQVAGSVLDYHSGFRQGTLRAPAQLDIVATR